MAQKWRSRLNIIAPKIATVESQVEKVSIEDFRKLEVRVGTVIEVSRVPRTDKLYKVIVDLGEFGKKQTITGLVGHYSSEELLHKRIAFVCNLKEAKFAGQLSQGMLLAASADDKLSLLSTDREIPNGARIS